MGDEGVAKTKKIPEGARKSLIKYNHIYPVAEEDALDKMKMAIFNSKTSFTTDKTTDNAILNVVADVTKVVGIEEIASLKQELEESRKMAEKESKKWEEKIKKNEEESRIVAAKLEKQKQ